MRVAALYDIHGNLPALDAVLDEVRRAGVDHVVVGGDVVPGPMARDVVARLLNLGIATSWIYGNCETAMLDELAGRVPAIPPQQRPIMQWTAGQFDGEYARMIASWPMTVTLEIPGVGRVLFCHATPRNENEIFTVRTAEARLRPVFDRVDASVVVCGHTHMQFDRHVGRVRVINAGSVGMPFGRTGADWLLLGPDVDLRHTLYDLEAAAALIAATEYPERAQFAAQHVLASPGAEQVLEACARVELH